MNGPVEPDFADEASPGKRAVVPSCGVLADLCENQRELEWIRAFMQSSPDAAVLVDCRRIIVMCNAQVEDLLGYTVEALQGQSLEMLVPERFRDTHPRKVEGFFAELRPVAIGLRSNLYGLHKDGREVPIEIGLTPLQLNGQVFAIAMLRNVTVRVQEVDKWRTIIDAAPVAIVAANENGQIILLNVMTERLFGYGRRELIGQSIEMLVPSRFQRQLTQAVQAFFAAPQAMEMGMGRDLSAVRKDGTEFSVELALSPAVVANQALMLLAVFTDTTNRNRMDREALAAGRIQRALLPRDAPRLWPFDIAAVCKPASETGGDFYDYILSPTGQLVIVVADTSGHGFGPALVAAATQCSLRTLLRTSDDLGEILRITNALLFDQTEEGQFVTVFMLALDPRALTLTYLGAGHEAHIFDRAGRIHHLQSTSCPLGLMPSIECQRAPSIAVRPGDLILVATDGVYEAAPPGNEQFGKDRMLKAVNDCRKESAQRIVACLQGAVCGFCKDTPQQDDLTIVAIKLMNHGTRPPPGWDDSQPCE